MIKITDTITLSDKEIRERFVRAVGPGGQNPNRDATAVELRLDMGRSSLPIDVAERLIGLAGRNVTNDGVLVLVGRNYRSQAKNREAVRARLIDLLRRAAKAPAKRKPTKIQSDERRTRRVSKQQHSAVKRARAGRED